MDPAGQSFCETPYQGAYLNKSTSSDEESESQDLVPLIPKAPVYQASIPNIIFGTGDTHSDRISQGYKVLKREYLVPAVQLSNSSYYLAGAAVALIAAIAAYIFGQIVLFGLGTGLTVALVFSAKELDITCKRAEYDEYFTLTRLLCSKVVDLTKTNILLSEEVNDYKRAEELEEEQIDSSDNSDVSDSSDERGSFVGNHKKSSSSSSSE